jgi:hypothetical protein
MLVNLNNFGLSELLSVTFRYIKVLSVTLGVKECITKNVAWIVAQLCSQL